MCGIVGFTLPPPPTEPTAWQDILNRMTDALAHRGPDDRGTWLGEGVGLGHRRLAIQDLSREGAQPMVSASGRYRVVFNGEIYNFISLQKTLTTLGFSFRSRCDTEVLLAAVEAWGLAGAVERFVGMFAFALWDGQERRLFLVRDRLGVKPLYYGRLAAGWVFASELKAFKKIPGYSPTVDRRVLARYMGLGYVPAPWSIWQDIFKVKAGFIVEIPLQGGREVRESQYWSMGQVAERGIAHRHPCQERLKTVLEEAVALRMVADAPVGAFLSGGIDSSLVVALMQRHSDRPVRTFAMGFEEAEFNEAHYARQVADYLKTDHHEWLVTPAEAQKIIPELPRIYDEPFADPSQIPTCLVSRLARQQVTVCLSGDGGDELFAGYNRYGKLQQVWSWVAWLPPTLRQKLGQGLRQTGRLSARLDKVAAALASNGAGEFYHALFANWLRAGEVVLGSGEGWQEESPLTGGTFLDDIYYRDMTLFLPDDILVKVDRASMDVGLEVRGPLLDHRLAELAWDMPLAEKRQGMLGKIPLRRLLYDLVPRELVDRPKQGFAVPMGAWLRGPLRGWAEDLLQEGLIKRQGFFNPKPVLKVWQHHLQGGKDWSLALWTVLMFQAWLAEVD